MPFISSCLFRTVQAYLIILSGEMGSIGSVTAQVDVRLNTVGWTMPIRIENRDWMSLLKRQKSNWVCWRLLVDLVDQQSFLKIELAELLHVLFMLSAAPVVWEGDPGLKLRDLVVEFSRWILGPYFISTLAQLAFSVSVSLWQLTRPLPESPRMHTRQPVCLQLVKRCQAWSSAEFLCFAYPIYGSLGVFLRWSPYGLATKWA